MDTKWLEDLIAIGKTGSLALAARQRHVTQPAFGRRIRALEAWAGVPLIDRTHRPVRLTEAGMKLLAQAQDMLQALGDTKAGLRRGSHPENLLRLGTGRTLARSFVADWLVQTSRLVRPALIEIRTGGLSDTLQWLESGQVDLLVAYHHPAIAQRPQGRGFLQKVLANDKLVPMIKRRLEVRTTSRQARAAPAALPFLSYEGSLALGGLVQDHLERCPSPSPLSRVLECDSADALLEYAIKGMGVCWLPWSLAGSACRQGLLETCWDRSMEIPFEVRLVRLRRRLPNTAEAVWQATPAR
jgi:DNA-binding transcriptional LysR family regulator